MANPNNPFGFRPVIRAGGSPFSVTEYGKAAADATAIFSFDLVGHITGGVPAPLPEAPTQYTLSRVQSGSLLTPGTSLWLGPSITYGAPSKATVHPVCDEIDLVMIAQCSGAVAITNAAHANLNANVLNTAGNTLTKQSAEQVNSAGIAATAGLDLRILRVAMITPNAEGANAIVEVMIAKHAFAPGAAGS
jgi:hypothetical protein